MIRDQAARMRKSLALPPAEGHISVDRDRHNGRARRDVGCSAHGLPLASALHGRRKALRTDGTGTTSARLPH